MTRWRLDITFDTLKEQEERDPQYAFPYDDCTRFIAWLSKWLGRTTEELMEIVTWNDAQTHVTIFSDVIDMYDEVMHFLIMESYPKTVQMMRAD